MSVTVVKIINSQLVESEDIANMINALKPAVPKLENNLNFRGYLNNTAERQCLELVKLEDFLKKKAVFREELAKRIPFRVQTYLE